MEREGRGLVLWLLAAGKSQKIMSRKRDGQAEKATRQTESAAMHDGFIGTDKVSGKHMRRQKKEISFRTVLY